MDFAAPHCNDTALLLPPVREESGSTAVPSATTVLVRRPTASIAAIIGAVKNALVPFGIKISEAPISRERIVALMNANRLKAAG